MNADLHELYRTLRRWIVNGKARPQSYTQLSRDYQKQTGIWLEPHGSWDAPLGELNKALNAIGAPALSALVILQDLNEPGNGFWGSAPNVPSRPRSEIDRISAWSRIIASIESYDWPESLIAP
jgi:hypothetical protein